MTEYKSSEWGYIPHSNQSMVTCPRCGNGTFRAYPQSVNVEAKVWCYEHECTKCGHTVAIEVERE